MKTALFGLLVGCFSLLCPSVSLAQDAVLYDFTASWCGPCQQMNPIVHKLNREGFPVRKVDVDQNPDLARQYRVTSIPAFVMVVNGREVDRHLGATTESHLRQMMARAGVGNPAAGGAQPATTQPNGYPSGSPQPGGLQPTSGSTPGNSPRNTQGTMTVAEGADGLEPTRLGNPAPFPESGFDAPAAETRANPPRETSAANPDYAPRSTPDYRSSGAANSGSGTRDSQAPVIRAQFDEDRNITRSTPHVDSRAANVRIRIRDESGINYGSGTVIESRPGKTYVLTCGHIFRNIQQESKVEIDVFTEDRYETFVGKVEKYDLDADVGLVSLPTDGTLSVARLAQLDQPLTKGDNVISVGCSGGQPPSIEQLNVTAINRYTGPDNVECTGVPVQGRSGGGLFNESQELVGVCIAADRDEKRGLYAGLAPILELVSNCGLSHLIRGSQPGHSENRLAALESEATPHHNATGAPGFAAQPGRSNASAPDFPNAHANPASGPWGTAGDFGQTPETHASGGGSGTGSARQALQSAQGARLTIVIEDPNQPGRTQVVIIPSATSRVIADLTGQLEQAGSMAQGAPTAGRPSAERPVRESTGISANDQPARPQERFEDRSITHPTDFPAAQPYRRVR